MVRLEMIHKRGVFAYDLSFTFQYGQIRNVVNSVIQDVIREIYIPVWLDQKLRLQKKQVQKLQHLHSSMVRLEITVNAEELVITLTFTFQYGQIRNEFLYKED